MGKKESNVENAIMDIVKKTLFSYDYDIPENIDWNDVFKELGRQGIIGLTNDIMPGWDLKEPLATEWKMSLVNQTVQYLTVCQKQNEMVEAFKNHNVDYAILKGTAAAMYYPKPQYRQVGDIDIIVDSTDFDKAKSIFEEMQYSLIEEGERHISFQNDSVEFELHRYFIDKIDPVKAKIGNNRILEMVHHTQMVYLEDTEFPVLPVVENGIVLLSHLRLHLKDGVGLRHILDWLMYANSNLNDEFWETSFKDAVEEVGLNTLAITTTRMGQLYFGLPTENMKWCGNADEEVCEALLHYVFQSGNHGLKGMEANKISNAVMYTKKVGLFANLQQTGLENWEICQKYIWMRPFAWLLQLFHYINKYRHIKVFRNAVEGARKSKERARLFDKLSADSL